MGADEYSDDELSPRERQQLRHLWDKVMVGSDSFSSQLADVRRIVGKINAGVWALVGAAIIYALQEAIRQ